MKWVSFTDLEGYSVWVDSQSVYYVRRTVKGEEPQSCHSVLMFSCGGLAVRESVVTVMSRLGGDTDGEERNG